MNNVKFGNQKVMELAQPAEIGTKYVWGNSREVMTLTFSAEKDLMDILETVRSPENIATIALLDEAGQYAYDDFAVFLAAGIYREQTISAESGEKPEAAEYIKVELGRLTYVEKQLAALGVSVV